MNLEALKKLITDKISHPPFSVKGEELETSPGPVTYLLNQFFETALTLHDATIVDDGLTSISVEGAYQKALFSVSDLTLRATFSIDPVNGDGNVVVQIESTSPFDSHWTLTTSFPALETASTSKLTVENPSFLFDSSWVIGEPDPDSKIGFGMSFDVDLTPYHVIATYLMSETKARVQGQIIFDKEIPLFGLDSSPSEHPLPIGTLSSQVMVSVQTEPFTYKKWVNFEKSEWEERTVCLGWITFMAEVPIQEASLWLETTVFSDTSTIVAFSGKAVGKKNEPLSIAEIGKALDGQPVADIVSKVVDILPESFTSKLFLLEGGFDLDIHTKQLLAATLSTRLDIDWTPQVLGEDLFTFRDLITRFYIDRSSTTQHFQTAFDMTGQVTLNGDDGPIALDNGQQFDVTISMPSTSFCCELVEGELDISSFIKRLIPVKIGIPQIVCEKLLISGAMATSQNGLSQSYFNIAATLGSGADHEWVVFEQGGHKLILQKIELDLHILCASKSEKSSFSGGIKGYLALPKLDNWPLFVEARYDSKEAEWEFSGGLLPSSLDVSGPVSLNDFINGLLTLVGIPEIPLPDSVSLTTLDLAYKPAKSDFSFNVSLSGRGKTKHGGGITLDQIYGVAWLHVSRDETDAQVFEGGISGALSFGEHQFQVSYDIDTEGKQVLSGKWEMHDKKGLGIADIMSVFGVTVSIPKGLDLALSEVQLTYSFDPTEGSNSALELAAKSENYGKATFTKPAGQKGFTFSIEFSRDGTPFEVSLSDIPMVSGVVKSDWLSDLKLTDFRLVVSTLDSKAPGAAPKGISLECRLASGDPISDRTFTIPIYRLKENDESIVEFEPMLNSEDDFDQADAPFWVSIERSFGPFDFNRIGFQAKDNEIVVALDAGIRTSSLGIQLYGLAVRVPTSKTPDFSEIGFGLQGLGVSMKTSSLEISGSLIEDPAPPKGVTHQYSGTALVKAASFNVSVLAQYATTTHGPSLFMFGMLDKRLGGPPYFVITGIALGMGYNRTLRVPTIDEVAEFPFVLAAQSADNPAKKKSLTEILIELNDKEWVSPSIGDNWIGAGVRFTSFELLRSFALVIVRFGTTFEVALIGFSNLAIPLQSGPSPPKAIAYAELAIVASFSPDKGLLAIDGRLTSNSYIFSSACVLTGGFAFYNWFKGDHAGDFVTTLGGYSPYVTVPSHYPVVPRVGFNWKMSKITIKGEMYFALTPSCLMAGGALEAVFESGAFKAWFNADAHMLIAWKPNHYFVKVRVSVGVSYTFRIKLGRIRIKKRIAMHLGVDVSLEGPPFHGRARVNLRIISFTVRFGDSSGSGNTFIPFPEFVEAFLTPDKTANCCSISAVNGVLDDFTTETDPTIPHSVSWVMSPGELAFTVETLLPAKEGRFTFLDRDPQPLKPDDGEWNATFDIGLVGIVSDDIEDATIAISIQPEAVEGIDTAPDAFDVAPIVKPGPKSLWKKREKAESTPQFETPTQLQDLLFGFSLSPKEQTPKQTVPVTVQALLSDENKDAVKAISWQTPKVPEPGHFDQKDATEVLLNTILDEDVIAKRTEILRALQMDKSWLSGEGDLSFKGLIDTHGHVLQAPPYLSHLGAHTEEMRSAEQ